MSAGDSEGPAWNKFWMSMDQADTESVMSGEGGSSHVPHSVDAHSAMSPDRHRPGMDRLDSVLPNDSASHNGVAESPDHSTFAGAAEEVPFTFKFKAPSGRVHRLQVAAASGIVELVRIVGEKLGGEAEGLGGVPKVEEGHLAHAGFALSYLDNEGDTVAITTDHDLTEAISIARQARKDKVDLFVHDPEKPAIPATLDPQPAITPAPEASVRARRRYELDGEDEEDEEYSRVTDRRRERKAGAKPQEPAQIIQGVPNELLLPGAIAVLAGVVIVTFALGRASSR